MPRARRPRQPRRPSLLDPIRESLGQVLAILTLSLALAIVGSFSPRQVVGECPGGGTQPRVVAMLRGYASTMPESGAVRRGGVPDSSPLTWPDVVGRDGIEPPTLRFSAARSTD
jgi:hypothetical protein